MKKLRHFILQPYRFLRAFFSALTRGFPGQKKRMKIIGVTGTNGKTTVANLTSQLLESAGRKTGVISTVFIKVGDKKETNNSKMTNFSAPQTQKLLKQMLKAGCEYAVIEVTSIGLDQFRASQINFDTVVFTNLTHDHLDYHGTFDAYKKAKGRLFKMKHRASVVNQDDPEYDYFLRQRAELRIAFSMNGGSLSDLQAQNIQLTENGSTFDLHYLDRAKKINLPLAGEFNISNALAATGACLAQGLSLSQIKTGLEQVEAVPGRLEKVELGQPFDIIIDYAHTPDAFERAFKAVKPKNEGRLITVFGATGDRDRTKRPILGEVASKYADIMVLTEEDPGSEDPAQIIQEIRPGLSDKFKDNENLFEIIDRKSAIAKAIELAQPNDVVILLAIGAQNIQVYKTGPRPYNERRVVTEILKK